MVSGKGTGSHNFLLQVLVFIKLIFLVPLEVLMNLEFKYNFAQEKSFIIPNKMISADSATKTYLLIIT